MKAPGTSGFSATLEGASLCDLVQLECMARRRNAIRVTSEGRVGYLFFDEGQIVHALTPDVAGQAAALEILGWNRGAFEPCHLSWPEQRTIQIGLPNLLLLAAQASDDANRNKVVEFRAPDPGPANFQKASAVNDSAPPKPPSMTRPLPNSARTPTLNSAPRVEAAVRLSKAGTVLTSTGDATDLAATAAYTARLAQLIGDSMGLGPLRGIECELETGARTVIAVEGDESLVAVQAGPAVDLSSMRSKAGL